MKSSRLQIHGPCALLFKSSSKSCVVLHMQDHMQLGHEMVSWHIWKPPGALFNLQMLLVLRHILDLMCQARQQCLDSALAKDLRKLLSSVRIRCIYCAKY